jgi:AraC-like DNA-binding protein
MVAVRARAPKPAGEVEMPSSAVRTFSDPDDYAAAIRQGTLELTVTERGYLTAKHIRIDLHRLWMQRVSENLSRIYHVDGWGRRAIIAFRAQTGSSLVHSGVELQPSNIVRFSAGQGYYQHSSGPTCFSSVSLPVADMVSVGAAMAGCDLTPPRDTVIITPSPGAMAKLQRLHAAAAHLAENAPEIIANPDTARGLEQALIEAMVGCLGDSEVREDTVARRQHELIMRRFRRVVEENPGRPLYIPEICKAIGVSDRTLRVCCQEQLGMGPKHYLLLRRLHLTQRALREASLDATTVTEIATRYGFWHFGRFAGDYQSLFGESPSVTLRRPAE